MDIYNIVKRPLITEKGTHQTTTSFAATRSKPARGGAYAFEVHTRASKPMIKEAIEKIYNVKVLTVRTSNRLGKARRVRASRGTTSAWKKATVVLDANSHIDLF